MLIKNIVIKVVCIAFLLSSISTIAQGFDYPYIKEYHKLRSKDIDSAEAFCNDLIHTTNAGARVFGIAGKAYTNTLRGNYSKADSLFELAKFKFVEYNLKKKTDVKGNIYYLNALRYIETHELETALNILNESVNFCDEKCSSMLNIRLLSALARVYSMSKNDLKSLEISRKCLNEIRNNPELLNNSALKNLYIKELNNAASRHINFFLSDSIKNKTYLDSAKKYTLLSQKFSEKHKIHNRDSYIYASLGDIAFYKNEYREAKDFYNKALSIFKDKKHKKKIQQGLFKVAECHYFLNENKEAKTIFLNQLENNIWSEYQLLSNEYQCYHYLFKINERENNLSIALDYAEKLASKKEDFLNTKNASDLSVNDKMHLREREKEYQNYIKNYRLQVKKRRAYQYLSIILIIGVIVFSIYFIQLKRAHKRNINNLNTRIEELQLDVLHKNKLAKTSSLTNTESLSLLQKIRDLEKEELYLKPNYTLNLLAKKLNTNSTYLSETVNKHLGISFTTYTNRLRVNSIISKMKTNKHLRNYTIEALAKEAGYKSVNSFNSNFKKLLKITPSQYVKEMRKKEN